MNSCNKFTVPGEGLVSTLREKCPNRELFLVRIQSECGKRRTRNNSVLDTFHAVLAL